MERAHIEQQKNVECQELGPEEMEQVLARYSDNELRFLLYYLQEIDLQLGCSQNCEFCALKTRMGPIKRFNLEAIKYFLDRKVGDKKVADILESSRSLSLLYYASEPLDNPDYEKILDLFCGRFKSFGRKIETSTHYPDKPDTKERVFGLLKKSYNVRISVSEANLERLVRDGFLVLNQLSDGTRVLGKADLPDELKGGQNIGVLLFSLRFKSNTNMLFRAGLGIDVGIKGFGRGVNLSAEEVEPDQRVREFGGSTVTFAPNGFFNYLHFSAFSGLTVEKRKKMLGGLDGLSRKVSDRFSENSFIYRLLSGEYKDGSKDVNIDELLHNGVLTNYNPSISGNSMNTFILDTLTVFGSKTDAARLEIQCVIDVDKEKILVSSIVAYRGGGNKEILFQRINVS